MRGQIRRGHYDFRMADQRDRCCDRRVSEDDWPDPEQMAIFRRMTAAERVQLAFRLREDAIRLRRACLRAEHPGESDSRIEARVREWTTGFRR
jgi:hypothetical protein